MHIQLVFAPRRRDYTTDFQLQYDEAFLWDFGWNYLYHKAWYKPKQQLLEKQQLGGEATKMSTK